MPPYCEALNSRTRVFMISPAVRYIAQVLMNENIEFQEDARPGEGPFIAVVVGGRRLGRIKKSQFGDWCYYPGVNIPIPELMDGDLETLKRAIKTRFER